MTLEEKRAKIRDFCHNDALGGCHDRKCPLLDFEERCFEDDNYVERNYDILFGENTTDSKTEETIESKTEEDLVNHPSHYTSGGIECLDAMAASMTAFEFMGYLKGAIIKYVWRYRLKGKPVEDLKKARFYLDKLIEYAEKESASV